MSTKVAVPPTPVVEAVQQDQYRTGIALDGRAGAVG
jgi:hypothetical protein